MKWRLISAATILLSLCGTAFAHRLDEYLQATLITVEQNRVDATMRLIPGVAVSSQVIAAIDSNGNGVFSQAEQKAYAERVLGDLSLSVDGVRLKPTLVSEEFPRAEELREGLGEIRIAFTADLPGGGENRRLILENHHESTSAVYLVNCLVPSDTTIRIVSQKRNEQQSFYELKYVQGKALQPRASDTQVASLLTNMRERMGGAGSSNLYRLGMRHIAEGTDHLLFLLTLLLPAPLPVCGVRWGGAADVRSSVVRILKIVTAFTVGHSITLALAAMGFAHVPSGPIEVLIAVSILVSAIHALRPLFPGREAGLASFFGLIHGLGFAATLAGLGLGRWERVGGILAFNLGIETMQLVVVAAILPSLILLSRTPAYGYLRIGGAMFAVAASVGWIFERLFGVHTPVDTVVNNLAHHAGWIAGGLFVVSLVCWRTMGDAKADRGQYQLQLRYPA